MRVKLLLAILLLTSAASASAASLGYRKNANAYSFYVNGGTTVFDSMQVDITPKAGAAFTNIVPGHVGGVPLRSGQPATYRNRALDIDKGWLIGGQTINANTFSYGVVVPGAKINTAAENSLGYLFLANVNIEPAAQFPTRLYNLQVVLVNQGTTVQTLTGFFLEQSELPSIPEPAGVTLAALAAAGSLALRRRRT